jgi:hypothetical protein
MKQKEPINKQNPMARDLRQPKYRQQIIPDKKKPKPKRKEKHKGDTNDTDKHQP